MSRTFSELVDQVQQSLEEADLYFGHGTDNAYDEAAWLVCHVVGVNLSNEDDLPWEASLDNETIETVDKLTHRRIETRQPLAYLIQEAWFAGLRFYIDDRAIVPRSHLGEWIPEQFSPWLLNEEPKSALDLCTGSGCIAIAIAKFFPEIKVDAVDLSESALLVARKNVELHEVADRVALVAGDMFSSLGEKTYDLIVCNPPYVAERLMQQLPIEYDAEPEMAFVGGETGLQFIDILLDQASRFLRPAGSLIVEAGSAKEALEQQYPNMPFTWLMSESGESVVFLLSKEDLH
ncbi:MAG: ribosomal protein L3 glutamine methyltransferase [Parasphingorhabdus sp.]|jgi:ribosomal protein L3 glutamine methyltransferase